MQLQFSFTTLLSTVVLALSTVNAFPAGTRPIQGELDLTQNVTLGRRAPPIIQVPLDIFGNDLAYSASFIIGTNPGRFNMIMDTGSSDFLVYADICPQKGNHNFVSPANSRMNINPGLMWGVEFADRSRLGGVVGQDILKIPSTRAVQIPGFMFGIISTVQGVFAKGVFDGVAGFAPAFGSRTKVPNLVQFLGLQGTIAAPVMGWKLGRVADGGTGSELSLGGGNSDLIKPGTTETIPNLSGIDWRVQITGVKVNGVPFFIPPPPPQAGAPVLPVSTSTQRIGILDTATSFLLVPARDAVFLNSRIQGVMQEPTSGRFLIPCNSQLKISLTIGGADWDIDPRDLVQQPNPPHVSGLCVSNIQIGPSVLGDNQWYLGALFMKNVYTTMDFGTNQITLSQLK